MSPLLRWALSPADIAKLSFSSLRPGVDIHVLHESQDGVRAAILRYAPGAVVPLGTWYHAVSARRRSATTDPTKVAPVVVSRRTVR